MVRAAQAVRSCAFGAITLLLLTVVVERSFGGFSHMASDAHVIVVGGGLAGLSASIEAYRAGAKVTLIDREKDVGGNSAKASSGINGCLTRAQEKLNIKDSPDKFMSDTMSAGDNANDATLVDLLVHSSNDAVEFLIGHGVDLMDINLCGGHSIPRTHWIPSPKEGKPSPVGITIIRALKTKLQEIQKEKPDRMEIRVNTNVKKLIMEENVVVGVETDNGLIKGTAVVLTTGGYSNDHTEDSLLAEFAKDKLTYPTTNGAFATGSGVKMARKIGAQLIDMDAVQIHPTGFIDPKAPKDKTKFLAAEALRGKGAILVNQQGERFANELGRRDYLTSRIQDSCSVDDASGVQTAWMLINDKAVDGFGWPAFNFYFKIKGFFQKFDNAAAFSKSAKIEQSTLLKTLNEYATAATQKGDKFSKTVFPVVFDAAEPIYAARVTPSIHYTMGGLKIDDETRVLNGVGVEMVGLYAAGEVTGGVHGRNRLGGNSLLECVVFGRIAGENAARHQLKHDEF